jgi:hypothetical protein
MNVTRGVDLTFATHLAAGSSSECQIHHTSAHFPKFVIHCGALLHELRKVMGYSQIYDSSTAFSIEVPGRTRGGVVQELQIGDTSL